jgi:beta-lactamase class A
MAFALDLEVPARVAPPTIVAPGPREVSFGTVAGRVSPGTHRVVVVVDGEPLGSAGVRGMRFELDVDLPPRDVAVEVVAEDALGNSAARRVGPVLGLPRAARATASRPRRDAALSREIDRLVREFAGITAVYVENLRTGAGAAWNAKAHFPAASTVKVGIAIDVLRTLAERPPPGSELDTLLDAMLVDSDNASANALLAWLGGSETAGAADVTATLKALGLADTVLYGGYLTAAAGEPIPLTVEDEPTFAGKYTTAYDLAQLFRALHLAALGRGPVARGLAGNFTPADARFLLFVLAHSADTGKLDRDVTDDAVVPHKGGWLTEARHDSGLVYAREGVFVVAVMTWTGSNAGDASDELAGRVARAALDRFRAAETAGGDAAAPSSSDA